MRTAAAYVRVSDDRQEEFSPASQIKRIKDYCEKNDILLPDDLIFSDDGISAKTTKNRKSFNEMIALAKLKDKPFDVILVWKFSRFARNQEESIVYKSLLKKNGVDVISISEPLSDNPFGGLIERIIEWMDEYYLIRLGDEVRRGMTERATRGMPNAAPPFGYRMIDGKYRIEEDEAATVREIFRMFVDGKSTRSIVTYLNNNNVRRRNGKPIDNRGVEYILYNPCYTGYLRWNPNGRSSSIRKYNNPEDILKKSDHEPIISEELFKKAQELLKVKESSNHKYAHENAPNERKTMLKGLVKCHSCGATLIYSPKNNGYQCHRYAKGICDTSHYISAPKLNKMVIEELRKTWGSEDINIEFEKTQKERIDYDKLIYNQKLKLQRIRNAYEDGAYTLSEYKTSKDAILDQIDKYERLKEEARRKDAKEEAAQLPGTVANLVEILENPHVPDDAKNQALKIIIDKIVLTKPENEIKVYFKP